MNARFNISERFEYIVPVEIYVDLVFPGVLTSAIGKARCLLKGISANTALIHAGCLSTLPDDFYIQFPHDEDGLLACFVKSRDGDTLFCEFRRTLTRQEVEALVTQSQIRSVLDALWRRQDQDVTDGETGEAERRDGSEPSGALMWSCWAAVRRVFDLGK